MGMDLSARAGYFRFSRATWIEVLRLAYDHGWKPAGTEPLEGPFFREDGTVDEELTEAYRQANKNWESMNYYTNDFQWVTDEDAGNIADALERALEAEPDIDEIDEGDFTDYLREFITFCRAGGFNIA